MRELVRVILHKRGLSEDLELDIQVALFSEKGLE